MTIMDFVCFKMLHTGEASIDILHQIIRRWNLERTVHTISTCNAASIVKRSRTASKKLYDTNQTAIFKVCGHFCIRRVVHVLNLIIKNAWAWTDIKYLKQETC